MVDARNVDGWSISPAMLFGVTPLISYKCGACGKYNETRLSLEAVSREKSYVVCSYCGEVNDTKLRYS